MERFLRTLWTLPRYRCDLYRVDGVLELRLFDGERVTQISTCRDSWDAARLAKDWLAQRS